jgi:biotin carboxylase
MADASPGAPLLLVGAGKMGLGYISAATRLGVPVRLAEYAALADRSRPLVERVVAVDSMLEESWYAGALAALEAERPGGVVAYAEPHVLAAALLADAYGVPGPGLHAAVVSRDKALQRALFGRAGIPQPEYRLWDRLADAAVWAAERFPVVVKPLKEAGSIGVELIAGAAAWSAAVQRRGEAGPVLVEQAVDGPEFSVECLVREAEVLFTNVTAKQTTGPPHFIEVCHLPGHRFASPAEQDATASFTTAVLRAIRMVTGIAHLEFRLTASGPVLMEIAVRTPGDYLMEAISCTWDFDLFEAVISLAVGRSPRLPVPGRGPVRAAASRFLFADPGRVTEITGQSDVEEHPAVLRCVLDHGIGDEVKPVRSSLDRAGHVLIQGADPGQRDAALDVIDTRLRIHTEPAGR